MNTLEDNEGFSNGVFDALDESTGAGNEWDDNDFGTTSGI